MADGKVYQHHKRHRHHEKAALQVRSFLQQHLQPALQFTVAVALCSILVFVRSITFPLACLAGVFVVVLHVLLVRDHHVGTLLLSSSGLLGAVWLGVLSAGILVTLTLQARTKVIHLAVLTIVASVLFGVYGIVKVTPLPFRLMLQGTNLMMTFGMSVVLSLFAPTVPFLWSYFISHMLLAFAAAALASCVAGIVVLPSFAMEAAMSNIIIALRKTGQTGTMCVSILLRPGDDSTRDLAGSYSQQFPDQQQQQYLPDDSRMSAAVADGYSTDRRSTLDRHGSLQVEDFSDLVAHPSQELDMMMHYTTPGQWGIKSFISAQSVASARSATAAAAAAGARTASTTAPAGDDSIVLAIDGRKTPPSPPPAAAAAAAAAAQRENVASHAAAAATLVTAVDETDASTADEAAAAATVDEDVVINLHKYSPSSSSSSSSDDEPQFADHNGLYDAAAAVNSGQKKKRHLGFNLLKKLSHAHYQHHHHHKQQQQQQSVVTQQQHLFVRLGRGVDLIRPHLLEARLLHDSVAVEQAWWVRFLVGGVSAPGGICISDWQALVNALDALLDRVAAYEGMLEGGPDRTSLSTLGSYTTLRATCGQIFAQAAALCGSLSIALQTKLQRRQQQQGLINKIIHSRTRSSEPPCPMLGFCWEASRQQLLAVMHCETQQYFARLAAADQSKPFRLDPARAVIGMTFLTTLSLAVIQAAQKLQTAGQTVLYGKQCAPAAAAAVAAAATAGKIIDKGHFGGGGGAAAAAPAGGGGLEMQPTLKAAAAAQAAAPTPAVAADAHSTRADPAPAAAASSPAAAKRPGSNSSSSSSSASNSSTAVLLDALLCLSVFRRLNGALLHQLPAAFKSKTALSAMVHKRRFQAGFKLWLVSSVALACVVAISLVWPTLPPNVMMFGFMAIVFTMKERVESSTEMVIIRVGSTVVGACLGHLLMFHPQSAEQPWGMACTLLFFAFILPPFTGGQFRLMLCLGLITFNSMVLCQYVGCCGATGSLIYFLGRIIATGGGTLLAMLVNRLLLPWERDRWAMEEMSAVLGLAVSAAEVMYKREFEFVAELTGHDPEGITAVTAAAADGSCGNNSKAATVSAGVGQRDHVAIAVRPLEQQQQQVGGNIQPESLRTHAPAGAAAAGDKEEVSLAEAAGDKLHTHHHHHHSHNQQQQPGQQQQQQQEVVNVQQQLAMIQGLLAPVSLAVQRDTWMKWKWAELAIPPVVPVMLSAVQQLTDALAALKVTLAQISDISQQQQKQQQVLNADYTPDAAVAAAAVPARLLSSSGSSVITVAGHTHEASEWGSVLLFDEFASLVHGSVNNLFKQLKELVLLVQQQVRSPTEDRKEVLQAKVAEIHQLRVALSIKYVKLRNARHRNFRQRFSALQQQQQWSEPVQQPAEGLRCGSQASGGGNASQSSAGSPVAGPSPAAAAYNSTVQQQQQQQQQQQGELLFSDPRSLQVDLASVQYMAFVYALRRVFNRALAVARCVADE